MPTRRLHVPSQVVSGEHEVLGVRADSNSRYATYSHDYSGPCFFIFVPFEAVVEASQHQPVAVPSAQLQCAEIEVNRHPKYNAVRSTHPSTVCGQRRPPWSSHRRSGPEKLETQCVSTRRCNLCAMADRPFP